MKPSDLRAVLVIEYDTPNAPRQHAWQKVSISGIVEKIIDDRAAREWLNSRPAYRQIGALVTDKRGEHLAVCWMLVDDSPELLQDVLHVGIVPATCAWSDAEYRIITTRTREQIQRHRRRMGTSDGRDLAFIATPTRAAMLHAYGLA
jgi:pyridoxine/pyridoxamine 5'-phosphate oxidase